jgi:hypothetical protein
MAVRVHQQSGAQPQTRPRGLWMRCMSVRFAMQRAYSGWSNPAAARTSSALSRADSMAPAGAVFGDGPAGNEVSVVDLLERDSGTREHSLDRSAVGDGCVRIGVEGLSTPRLNAPQSDGPPGPRALAHATRLAHSCLG